MMTNYAFRRASSIHVPEEFFKPLRTGIHEVDDSWSELGGIIPSQVTLITGKPGSGKTTLTLAIGSCFSSSVPVAFISLEMSDFQLAHQARKIPGFGKFFVTDDFDPVKTMELLKKMKPGLIIVDSIQKAARKVPKGKNDAQIEVVNIFSKFAKETWCSVFLIGHCDKAGNYKGPSDLAHDVDSHCTVSFDSELDTRNFSFEKNRFGGIVQESLFGITRERIWVGTPYINEAYPEATVENTVDPTINPSLTPSVAPDKLGEAVKQCMKVLDTGWNGSTVKATIFSIVEFMRVHDSEFPSRGVVKDPGKVHVKFKGRTVAHADPRTGELNFGRKSFDDTMQLGKVGYKKEQKFMTSRITKRSEVLLWIVLHEWCHLYDGMTNHTNAFFSEIGKKFDWMKKELSL